MILPLIFMNQATETDSVFETESVCRGVSWSPVCNANRKMMLAMGHSR